MPKLWFLDKDCHVGWLLDVSHVMLKDIWCYWYADDWSLVLPAVLVADSDAEFNKEEFFIGCFIPYAMLKIMF